MTKDEYNDLYDHLYNIFRTSQNFTHEEAEAQATETTEHIDFLSVLDAKNRAGYDGQF